MDRRGDRKRAREGEEQETPALGKKNMKKGPMMQAEDAAAATLFEDAAAAAATAAADGGEGAWWQQQRPAWVFDLPWLKTRGGLGLSFAAGGWEHRDVFFRSLVDGAVATIVVPGDRLISPPSMQTLFGEVEAWLAMAAEDEVDPFWRAVLEAPPRPLA